MPSSTMTNRSKVRDYKITKKMLRKRNFPVEKRERKMNAPVKATNYMKEECVGVGIAGRNPLQILGKANAELGS